MDDGGHHALGEALLDAQFCEFVADESGCGMEFGAYVARAFFEFHEQFRVGGAVIGDGSVDARDDLPDGGALVLLVAHVDRRDAFLIEDTVDGIFVVFGKTNQTDDAFSVGFGVVEFALVADFFLKAIFEPRDRALYVAREHQGPRAFAEGHVISANMGRNVDQNAPVILQ